MRVDSVNGPDGESFPFLQWEFLPSKNNFDEFLLVDLGDAFRTAEPGRLTVTATGPLFDPFYSTFYLAEEDIWHPRIHPPPPPPYTIRMSIPKRQRAVAAGTLVSETVLDGRRSYEFQTPRPTRRATLYYGDFRTTTEEADGTVIEVYAQHQRVDHGEIAKTAKEVGNMVRAYNRLFRPLDLDSLRVVGTPTKHGRGFEGLVLISEGGFRNSSYSEVFLAHEVAHQWWGNLVDGKTWPEDRWLMEASPSTLRWSTSSSATINPKKPGW